MENKQLQTEIQDKFQTVQFMIVDDDDVSVMGIKRSIKELKISNPVFVARDGIEALSILRDSVDSNNQLPPFIITLDLSMPRMNGLEFLDVVRKDPLFKKLVVFVLTTSEAPKDINLAYEKNIAGYIVKENATQTFRETLSLLRDYSQLVVLPT